MIIDLLIRLIVVCFAFFCAIVAASLFFVVAVVGLDGLGPQPGEMGWEQYARVGMIAGVVASVSGTATLIPLLFAASIAEAMRLRGLVLHLAVGALAGAAATYTWTTSRDGLTETEFSIGAAAGAVGAFVYWGLAGRNAGKWRERSPRTRPDDPNPPAQKEDAPQSRP